MLFAVLAALAGLVLGDTSEAQAPPALPTVVTGVVVAEGRPAGPGITVAALIEGQNCGQTTTRGDGTYVLQVGGRPNSSPSCDKFGASVQFAVGGRMAIETTTRDLGELKIVALTATEQTVAVPTPPPTPRPPGPGAEGTPPAAMGAPAAQREDGGFRWWPLAIAGAALVAGAALLARRRMGGQG